MTAARAMFGDHALLIAQAATPHAAPDMSFLIGFLFLPLQNYRKLTGVLAWALVAMGAAQGVAQAQPAAPSLSPAVAQEVDWSRYTGKWYELARLPNSFQRKCVSDVTAEYTAVPGGRIRVVNQCVRDDRSADIAAGEAREVVDGRGRLKVRFAPDWLAWLPVVWGDYWVIGLDDSYQTALVGTPDREFLWLLSRNPQRTPAEVDAWLRRAATLGFDVGRVVRTTQTAANPTPPPAAQPPSPGANPDENSAGVSP